MPQVIISLQEGRPHVPYRNSVLTMALRDSLGGNTRTVMVAAVAPEAQHIEESISTCRFAQRVAMISNRCAGEGGGRRSGVTAAAAARWLCVWWAAAECVLGCSVAALATAGAHHCIHRRLLAGLR